MFERARRTHLGKMILASLPACLFLFSCSSGPKAEKKEPDKAQVLVSDSSTTKIDNLKRRAASGDVDALVQLGRAYEEGDKVNKSLTLAREYYLEAANKNSSEGAWYLSGLLLRQSNEKDDFYAKRAMKWLQKSADLGNAEAQRFMGNQYGSGRLVAKNEELAFHYYLLGAKGGDYKAAYLTGVRFLDGNGTAVDADKGVRWLEESAKSDYLPACATLARIFKDGKFVKPDAKRAKFWKRKARILRRANTRVNLDLSDMLKSF